MSSGYPKVIYYHFKIEDEITKSDKFMKYRNKDLITDTYETYNSNWENSNIVRTRNVKWVDDKVIASYMKGIKHLILGLVKIT